MSDHYITYLELTDDERTSCSTLSDALSPTNRPQYELPQDVYHPKARTPLVRGMDPILFHEWSGAPWVSLPGLHGNLAELANTMLGGWDLVFAQRPNRQMKIELRIMWPGYTVQYITQRPIYLRLDAVTTTRAMLAQIIGHEVERFMQNASEILSTQTLYKIGRGGIQSGQVLLGGIENTYDDTWQAKIYIDN